MKLLGTNTKLEKGDYNIVGLALAPAKTSGRNVCPQKTKSCESICVLWHRGMTVMPNVRSAMINRTNLFFDDRSAFLSQLHKELATHNKRDRALARLNVASDIRFDRIDPSIYTNYPNITHYGYTKIYNFAKEYAEGKLPPNLHVTYSWSERSDIEKTNWLLENNVNVAMVMNVYYGIKGFGELPKSVKIGNKKWPVVCGDKIDARIPEVDGRGVVVGLRAKIKKSDLQTYINSGFVVTAPWEV